MEKKHWLAVAFFVIMIIIVQIIVSSPAFGATFVYNDDNGERKVQCMSLSQNDYVRLAIAYNEGKLDFVNYRDCSNTWWHFVNEATGCHIWLTKEEGIEVAFYLQHMFNTTW